MAGKVQRLKVSDTKAFGKLLQGQKTFPMLVFYYGKDTRLAEDMYHEYLSHLQKIFSTFEETHINGAEVDLAVFHAELCTIPMFESNRLIWLRHADNMFKTIDKKKDNNSKKAIQNFISDFSGVPKTTAAFIHLDEDKIATSFTSITKNQFEVMQQDLKEKDLPAYIRQKVMSAGYQMESKAELLLMEKCAYETKQVLRELDNLFTYCLKEKVISTKDIEEFSTDMEGDLLYAILDLVAQRNIDKAIQKFSQNKMDEKTSGLFSVLLTRLFTDALRYRYLHSLGLSTRDIHSRLGYPIHHDFIVQKNERKLKQISQLYNSHEISAILEQSYILDERLKTKAAAQKQILFAFLFFLKKPLETQRLHVL